MICVVTGVLSLAIAAALIWGGLKVEEQKRAEQRRQTEALEKLAAEAERDSRAGGASKAR